MDRGWCRREVAAILADATIHVGICTSAGDESVSI